MQSHSQNKLLKVLSLNSFSVAVSMILGIFSTKIISIFLGPPGMALLGSFRNFTTGIKSLSSAGINTSIIRLFVENRSDKKKLSEIYTTFFWTFLTISVLLATVVFIFASPISFFLFNTDFSFPVRLFALLLPLIVLNSFWMALYNALESFRKIVAIQILSNILIFGITVFFVWNGNLEGGLISIALGELAMVVVTFIFISRNPEHFRFRLQKLVRTKYLKVIGSFSAMALLSAVIGPATLILIRNFIIDSHSVTDAGIWDGANRISGFYMIVFNSGLALYYMPKLSGLKTDAGFVHELKNYFITLVPIFVAMLTILYVMRNYVIAIVFTAEFAPVADSLKWQFAGDLLRIMTLAFGFQIVVKTMLKEYFLVEIVFNSVYLGLSYWLVIDESYLGALQSYFYANLISFLLVLVVFRKLLVRQYRTKSNC